MDILKVDGLRVCFSVAGATHTVVDGVSFDIKKGEVFGIVGESGSGKTVTALSVLKLIYPPGKITAGEAFFEGVDLFKKDEEALRAIRGSKISFVFQEPSSAFNPVFTIGYQITEAIAAHSVVPASEARRMVLEYLRRARIQEPERIYHSYPHQLSGGTKQRAMIAMALINSPQLLILDEPTTALDVKTEAGILDLLEDIIKREHISILFISHDFGIIKRMCSRVAVMHNGRIIESGNTEDVMSSPRDRYTASLLESVRALS